MFKGIFSNDDKMRCPSCGFKKSKKLDNASADANDIMGILQSQINEANPELSRYNKHTRFRCIGCSHEFNETVAIEWEKIANKLGNDRAINEYRKLR